MSPEQIDQAIDALPDQEFHELHVAAAARWRFRVETWALAAALAVAVLLMFFPIRTLIQSQWPGSPVAATLGALAWCAVLFGSLRILLSFRFATWRTRLAARREYRRRIGGA